MRMALAFVVLLAGGALRAWGEDPLAAPEISLTLELTAMSDFDPDDPQGEIVCVVRNNTDAPLTLPGEYDGGQIVLHGGGLTLQRPRRLGEKPEVVKNIVVPSQSDAVLFKLPLGEILLPTERVASAPPDWYWTWMRRPAPPRSPLLRYRNEGYVEEVLFLVEMRHGGEDVRSPLVTLKVRPNAAAKESGVDVLP